MNVRSATAAMLALAPLLLALIGPSPAAADEAAGEPHVTIAMVPRGTDVEELTAAVPGIAPGLLSSGLGQVTAGQTYLDVTQGNRLAQSLYDERLPPLYVTGDHVPERIWRQVRARASGAPAELVPGLLASTLTDAGVPVAAQPVTGSAALIAADRRGRIARTNGCALDCPGVVVARIGLGDLAAAADRLDASRGDLLIVIERPPGDRELLSLGILGAGFEDGDLTSPTTRMDGYVLTTDLLPTILERYGVAVPDEEVDGRVITTTGGSADPALVDDREDRLSDIGGRRWGVLAVNLLIWAALAALAAAIGRRRGGRAALATLAVAMAYVPVILLLTASIAPSALAERLIVGIGAPALAAATLLALRPGLGRRAPYAAFGVAAAVSIGATAVDVIAGSPLTALSLLGPNPALGVRFFGIGNELEATIAVLLLLGAGAAITAARPSDPARAMAITTVLATGAAVLVFAPGRLGADVGAAITFPAGAAVAVIVALRLGRRKALLVLAAPVAALALLILIDLLSGGDAHLSRSVLGADGLRDLGDVFQRRIEQSARSFPRYVGSPFLAATVVAIVAGVVWRERIASWLSGRPAALAGVAGAAAATVVGTLANDSGALLLIVGTGFVAAFCGLAWSASDRGTDRDGRLAADRVPR